MILHKGAVELETITFLRRYNIEFNIINDKVESVKKLLEMSNFECLVKYSYRKELKCIIVQNITVCQAQVIKTLIKKIKIYD